MEPPLKKTRITADSGKKVLIRLADAFLRTDGNCICPIIKAENSIRILYMLQDTLFKNILRDVSQKVGLKQQTFEWKSAAPDRKIEGNIFIQYTSSVLIDDKKIDQYREILTSTLRARTKVKFVLIDNVMDTKEIILQPLIAETDFEMYKLELCYKELSEIPGKEEFRNSLDVIAENIKSCLKELKEHRTKIAVLSQNGKGKSFFLNLLLLMTSDNEEEYVENNKDLQLPKNVIGNPTVENINEELIHLPDVVKEFIKNYPNEKEDFKTLMEPLCHELQFADPKDMKKLMTTFLDMPKYFTDNKRLDVEPYILAQKSLEGSYDSTTKCNVHLRYGTVYQLKVEYFDAEELQNQLFELVTLKRNANEGKSGINKQIQKKSCECLKTRFDLLTDYGLSSKTEDFFQMFNTYKDIELAEEVTKFAGKTEMHLGLGKESTFDRLALQGVLRRLTSLQDTTSDEAQTWKTRSAAVKEIVVYLPCKILSGGKEIMEMPGTDDSDPLAMDFIEKAMNTVDAVFVLSEFAFKIAEREVKEILLDSEFMQSWKKNPACYALMFLAYPEKDSKFQFGKDDKDKIKCLEQMEKNKRTVELQELTKLLDINKLTGPMDKSIYTSYVLPVLHTSIHTQKGAPHNVLSENADFLKVTGIGNLLIHLDSFISSKVNENSAKVEKHLSELHKCINTELTVNESKSILKLLRIRAVKDIREYSLSEKSDILLRKLRKQLELLYTKELKAKVVQMLEQTAKEAYHRWNINEENINGCGIFNPYFCGNHPCYEVRLYNIIFGDPEIHKSQIFDLLRDEIKSLLLHYKADVMKLFTEELNDVYAIIRKKNVNLSMFVKQAIGHQLNEALCWYIGKQQMPINKRKIGQYLDQSKKLSLKKHILTPAYAIKDLELAKQKAKENIQKAVMDVQFFFLQNLEQLHLTRWKSFTGHIKTKNATPKMWHVLLGKLNLLSRSNETQAKSNEFSNVFKMISAKLQN